MAGAFNPIELEKDGEKAKCFHAVDLQGWLNDGWKPAKGGAKSEPKQYVDGLDGMTDKALLEIAEKKLDRVDSRWSRDTLIAKIRGEK